MQQVIVLLTKRVPLCLCLVSIMALLGCPPSEGPTASFTATPINGPLPLTVNFTDTSDAAGATITAWLWSFGDNESSTDQNPSHTYAAAGTYTVTFMITTADGGDTVTVADYIVVERGAPDVTWPTASPITYGDTLADSTLSSGTGSTPGTFAFADPGTAPDAGTFAASVVFTPDDTVNYLSVTGTVQVDVAQATPVVTAWPAASGLTYGDTLAASALTGGEASVPGTFAFTAPETAPNAGAYLASIAFVPEDSANYAEVPGEVEVVVEKATPAVTSWPTPSAITYGQTLADSTLSGGEASVPGAFAFDDTSPAPDAGTYDASVTFTPSDTDNYVTVSGVVTGVVEKATPAVTEWPAPTPITYGQTLADSTLAGGEASVAGTFAFSNPGTAPGAGVYDAAVKFTPDDVSNYNEVLGSVSVTVGKATPVIATWPTASAITYGQTLADSTLSGGEASVPGTFAFDNPGTAPDAGVFDAAVTFTPTDAANYEPVQNTVSVEVQKALSEVTAWPTASPIIYGQTLADSTLTGGEASVPGTFAFENPGTTHPAGTHDVSVVFTPTSANYSTVSGQVSVVVAKATPYILEWPAASTITYGQTLADSSLTGGRASTPGKFTFDDPAVAPDAGTYDAAVTFTPEDTANYVNVAGSVPVEVRKAAPDVTEWPTASAIYQGQTLADSILTGGAASVAGSFAFADPAYAPDPPTYAALTVFTPTDSGNYKNVSGIVFVTVMPRWCVKPGGDGDGSSWDLAFGSIQDAVDAAAAVQSGGEVWVAAGTYTGTGDNVVELKPFVKVYGGFAGTELTSDTRNWETNSTFIDGEDTRRCVLGADNAVLDGFIVQNGSADYGAGMYNEEVSPTIGNCTFSENGANLKGGGICNAGFISPAISFCTFDGNTAGDGGGMYNTWATPTVTDCTFSGNEAFDGGGMHNEGHANGVMTRCVFTGNIAYFSGGGVYNLISSPAFNSCTFSNNSADDTGGGMFNGDNIDTASPAIVDCEFTGNTAYSGGGMQNYNCFATVSGSAFNLNAATINGGGMDNRSCAPLIESCGFDQNTARFGGGICFSDPEGGETPLITGCTFTENACATISGAGGGIYSEGFSVTAENCVFWNNNAYAGGGGICVLSAPASALVNCTFSCNTTNGAGEAVYLDTSDATITNSILWNSQSAGNEIEAVSCTATVTYSCIEGGYTGTGNIGDNPQFQDSANGDLGLTADSDCVDSATAGGAPDTDILGVARPQGAGYDMGAYEYVPE